MTYREAVLGYLQAHGTGTAKAIGSATGVWNIQSLKMVMLEMRRKKLIIVSAKHGRENVFALPLNGGADIGFRKLRKAAPPTPAASVSVVIPETGARITVAKLGDEFFLKDGRCGIPPEACEPVPGWYFPRPSLPIPTYTHR